MGTSRFFFDGAAPTGIYTLSRRDAVPVSPCAPPAPAATEPGELQVRLAALDGQAPEALWNTVQELAGKLTESFGTQLAEVLNDEGFFDKGQEYRFVAAALALGLNREPGLRKIGLTATLVLARKAGSDEIRSFAIRLLGEAREVDRGKRTPENIMKETEIGRAHG